MQDGGKGLVEGGQLPRPQTVDLDGHVELASPWGRVDSMEAAEAGDRIGLVLAV